MIFTFLPWLLAAQLTLSIDLGLVDPSFDQAPNILFPTLASPNGELATEDILNPTATLHFNLLLGYDPANTPWGAQLRVQHLRRGYEHVVRFSANNNENDAFQQTFSQVTYLDFMPQLAYRNNELLSVNAGPYVSIPIAECCNTARSLTEQSVNGTDLGINLGGNLHFNRFHLSLNYQYSLRQHDFHAFNEVRQLRGNRPDGLDRAARINAVRFGVGFLLLR